MKNFLKLSVLAFSCATLFSSSSSNGVFDINLTAGGKDLGSVMTQQIKTLGVSTIGIGFAICGTILLYKSIAPQKAQPATTTENKVSNTHQGAQVSWKTPTAAALLIGAGLGTILFSDQVVNLVS